MWTLKAGRWGYLSAPRPCGLGDRSNGGACPRRRVRCVLAIWPRPRVRAVMLGRVGGVDREGHRVFVESGIVDVPHWGTAVTAGLLDVREAVREVVAVSALACVTGVRHDIGVRLRRRSVPTHDRWHRRARRPGTERGTKQSGCHRRGSVVVTDAEFAVLLSPPAGAIAADGRRRVSRRCRRWRILSASQSDLADSHPFRNQTRRRGLRRATRRSTVLPVL